MQPMSLRGLDGSHVKLDAAAVTAALKGEVLTPDSAAYQEARSLWNGMIDRRPGLIVRPNTESEVANAVNFARETTCSSRFGEGATTWPAMRSTTAASSSISR